MAFEIANIRKAYLNVFVIVSPPRCSSTALARVFWEHPLVRYYSHEPFEVLYYSNQSADEALSRLQTPLDLRPLKKEPEGCVGNGIVIKEMPYQIGKYFELLVLLATAPIIFLIRDPRLSISSRIKKRIEVGDSPLFPITETGWNLLEAQIAFCQRNKIQFFIVDSSDFRNHPSSVLKELFKRLKLSFSSELLRWKPQFAIDIDNLGGRHSHLYYEVLRSERLLPDEAFVPPLELFPEDSGFRQHVIECLNIYSGLKKLPELLNPRKQKSDNNNSTPKSYLEIESRKQ